MYVCMWKRFVEKISFSVDWKSEGVMNDGTIEL